MSSAAAASSSASPVPPEDDVCSVCHDRFRIPCQANCSHWFCGECIIRVWNHGAAVQPCKCPICRRLINLLVPANVSDDQNDDPQLQRVLGEIQHYNHIFGGAPRSLTQVYCTLVMEVVFHLFGIYDLHRRFGQMISNFHPLQNDQGLFS
uniref:RING-type domain-containing protein n=1 Tax=Aegilops tauschii subsp. strangulata TaxID=200361 RepID=A0A453ME11_AEGTS